MLSAPLLVCFAVKEEARPFQSAWETREGDQVLITGMGHQNAERAIRQALGKSRPGLVLTCGFAGGLDPALPTGSVVFETAGSPEWVDRLTNTGARPATFHCARRIAVSAREKAQLRESSHADAVEMESGVIAGICRAEQIPCATVRVVLDTASQDLPLDFNRLLTPEQRIDPRKLALALLRNPGRVPELIRFQRQVRVAAACLASVLVKITANPS